MRVSYKGQEPIYSSNFLDDILENNQNYKVTFLGNHKLASQEVDLYFVEYKKDTPDGRINAVYQYGNDPSEYGSGAVFMYMAERNGLQTPYAEIYKRAVSAGLLVEKEYFVGYSEEKQNELDNAYFESDYIKNKPDYMAFREGLSEDLSEDEIDKREEEFDAQVAQYDKNYKSLHGQIPVSSVDKNYHVFDSYEEAKKYCNLPENGFYTRLRAVNAEHLDCIASALSCSSKFLYGKQARERSNEFKQCRQVISEVKKELAVIVSALKLKSEKNHVSIVDSLAKLEEFTKTVAENAAESAGIRELSQWKHELKDHVHGMAEKGRNYESLAVGYGSEGLVDSLSKDLMDSVRQIQDGLKTTSELIDNYDYKNKISMSMG